jgi:hypothetical protein
MEDNSDARRATSANALEDHTDATLSLLFGGNLQAATLRLAVYVAILSAIVATIVSVV